MCRVGCVSVCQIYIAICWHLPSSSSHHINQKSSFYILFIGVLTGYRTDHKHQLPTQIHVLAPHTECSGCSTYIRSTEEWISLFSLCGPVKRKSSTKSSNFVVSDSLSMYCEYVCVSCTEYEYVCMYYRVLHLFYIHYSYFRR
jgi:hypothetical protein